MCPLIFCGGFWDGAMVGRAGLYPGRFKKSSLIGRGTKAKAIPTGFTVDLSRSRLLGLPGPGYLLLLLLDVVPFQLVRRWVATPMVVG